MSDQALRVVRSPPGLVWRAYSGEREAGSVSAFLLPNGRWFVSFGDCEPGSRRPLLRAVAASTGSDLYLTVEDTDLEALQAFARLGFAVGRRESLVMIPVDPAVTGLDGAAAPPDGVAIISAAEADVDRLRLLDDTLRADVPGAEGWRWDPDGFREETFSDAFDPATYLVAVEEGSGEYVGLARVWADRGGPRLGLIAVTRPYRRRGLARVLLGRAFLVLHERGETGAVAEVDDANTASWSLLRGLGAQRTGGTVELVLTGSPRSSSAAP